MSQIYSGYGQYRESPGPGRRGLTGAGLADALEAEARRERARRRPDLRRARLLEHVAWRWRAFTFPREENHHNA